ncbi:MAG TPA: RNA polymerase sigma factor SigF [Halomicronema sp.]
MTITVSKELKTETLELLRQYQTTRSPELRNRLVELNLGLVRKEVHHWINQCSETYEDLLQVGSIGLLRAIERFEMSKGHAFSSFAVPYIRGEIQHYLRDKSSCLRIPRQWIALQSQATSVIQSLQIELKRQPSDAEIAAALQISLTEWQQVKLANRNRSPLSLDAPLSDEDEGCTSLAEIVPDTHYRSFQLAQEDVIRLQQALSTLEDRTRKILEFVFLYDLTQKETAERMGISAVTVSRRVKKGLDSLKNIMTVGEIDF